MRNVSTDDAKANCLTNTKTCLSSYKEHQPNVIYCKMMEH